jgi:hypothetical protein
MRIARLNLHGESPMTRRLVKETGAALEAARESNPKVKRQFQAGAVLNILQWTRPENVRFTVEGEGAEVWVCDRTLMERQTDG